jgi:protein-disulfide isomerase/uncharacterized membrane protein
MANRKDKESRPSAAGAWLWVVAFLSVAGGVTSIYLSVLHWKVCNLPGHVSFCAVSEGLNCDTVAVSKYSAIASVPTSTWGLLFYGLCLVLALWGAWEKKPTWPWGALSLLNGLALAATAHLFLASSVVLQTLCVMCAGLYAVNVLTALACILGQRRVGLSPSTAASVPLLGILAGAGLFALGAPSSSLAEGWPTLATLAGAALLGLVGLNLKQAEAGFRAWSEALGRDFRHPFANRFLGLGLLVVAAGVVVVTALVVPRFYPASKAQIAGGLDGMAHGHTPAGHAWIGAEKPEVTVVEFSDYECPFCRKAHEVMREVVRKNNTWLRLVHMHMPLDNKCNDRLKKPFHHHSCASAMAAECAAEQDAFWVMNDKLFVRRGGLDAGGLVVLAQNMGLDGQAFRICMRSDRPGKAVADNLAVSRRLRLKTATPIFRIESQVVIGLKDHAWWQRPAERMRAKKNSAAAPPPPPGREGPDDHQAGPGGG